ncbi:MAG: hypothetical protein GX905_03215 [Bacteroidales bacterium]|nr:hypothetical protein [Bacteroidales bacterium]
MEKNNDLNKFESELDFLCLKDHLNASFDKDNISVSDDLINRTLQAAKEKTSSDIISLEEKKKNRIPTRGIIQVAAAILFVFVFYNFTSNFRMGKKESPSESASEANSTAASDMEAKSDDIPYTSRSNNVTEEAKENAAEQTMEKTLDSEETVAGQMGDIEANSFVKLYPVSAEHVFSFALTGNAQETVKGDAEHVNELFSILDAYFFIPGDKNISSGWNYKIVFTTDAAQTFTIWIGDGIQINQKDGVTETELYYSLENIDDLLIQVEELYKNLSEN